MRLIKTSSITFQEFDHPPKDKYAIVSHRWREGEEASFETFPDYASPKRQGYGWRKVLEGCRIARLDGLKWIWIDTCCIDKESDSEVSEAINSMYQWYEQAAVCYVFLRDVDCVEFGDIALEETDAAIDAGEAISVEIHHKQVVKMRRSDNFPSVFFHEEHLPRSQWFTRGWTLQELLAPKQLRFFNADFEFISSREDQAVNIAAVTGIDAHYMLGTSYHATCYAERLRWASKRVTTRPEDRVYSLLGLFGVSMAPSYGEGEHKAWVRFIRKLHDGQANRYDLLAWESPRFEAPGLLGSSSAEFYCFNKLQRAVYAPNLPPFEVTDTGVEFAVSIPNARIPETWKEGSNHVDRPLLSLLLPLNTQAVDESKNIAYQFALWIHCWQSTGARQLIARRGPKLGRFDATLTTHGGGKGMPPVVWLEEADVEGADAFVLGLPDQADSQVWSIWFPHAGLSHGPS